MAEYDCPNCGGYRDHNERCPTGGLAATARNRMYTDLHQAFEDYRHQCVITRKSPKVSEVLDILDKVWQEGFGVNG